MQWPKDQAEIILADAGINAQRRAQTLAIDEWEALTDPDARATLPNQADVDNLSNGTDGVEFANPGDPGF